MNHIFCDDELFLFTVYVNILHQEKKEEIWLSPMTKAPTHTEKIQKRTRQHKTRHQKLRLHNDCGPTYTVSWNNDSNPNGVV